MRGRTWEIKDRLLPWLRRRWLLVLATVAFIGLIVARSGDIRLLCTTVLQGQWQWLLVAAALQVAYYALFGALYQVSFSTVGVRSRVRDLIPVLLASVFVTTIAPTGGMSAAALFIDDAARHGQSPIRAAEGVLLVMVVQNIALLPVLGLGMAYLGLIGHLPPTALTASGLFVLLALFLGAVLLVGHWQAARLHAALQWLQRKANALAARLKRRPFLAPGWAESTAGQICGAATAVARRPRRVGLALVLALAHTAVNLASLYAVFLAFHQTVAVGAAAAGFALAIVSAVISALPLDAALMQSVMAMVFTSLGVPLGAALAVVLVFGGLNSWLPLTAGFLLLRQISTFGGGAPA